MFCGTSGVRTGKQPAKYKKSSSVSVNSKAGNKEDVGSVEEEGVTEHNACTLPGGYIQQRVKQLAGEDGEGNSVARPGSGAQQEGDGAHPLAVLQWRRCLGALRDAAVSSNSTSSCRRCGECRTHAWRGTLQRAAQCYTAEDAEEDVC